MVLVSLLVNVILSPDLAIVRPVPASKTISSTLLPLPPAVNLIFSSSALSPSKQEIEYVVLVLLSIEARSILWFNEELPNSAVNVVPDKDKLVT